MMPRSFILSLLVFALYNNARAQEGLHISILGRAESAMINGDFFVRNFQNSNFALKKQFTAGYQAGIAGGYGFNDHIGANIGFYYSVQGMHYADFSEEVNDLVHTFKRSVTLNYLKIPVHATYISDATSGFSFSAFAGFYYAMLLSYSDKSSLQYSDSQGTLFTGTATVTGDSYKWDYADHGAHNLETYQLVSRPYRSYDYGISAGAGMVLRLSDMVYLPVMLTYQLGLADIKNHSASETRYGSEKSFWGEYTDANKSEKYHNSSVGIAVGLKLLIDELAGY